MLAAMLGIGARFREVRVVAVQPLTGVAVRELVGKITVQIRALRLVTRGLAFNGALFCVPIVTCNIFRCHVNHPVSYLDGSIATVVAGCPSWQPSSLSGLFLVGRRLGGSDAHAHAVKFAPPLRGFGRVWVALNQVAQIANAGLALIGV